MYTKHISKFLYLHSKSNHPAHVFTGIMKGELICYLRNTSSHYEWFQKVKFLFSKLSEKGYTRKWLLEEFKYVKFKDQDKYFKPKRSEKSAPSFGITIFQPDFKKRWLCLGRWSSFYISFERKSLEKCPKDVIFQRGKTIGKELISSLEYADEYKETARRFQTLSLRSYHCDQE